MDKTAPTPITQETIPDLIEKHNEKIDRSIGYDSDTQQARLKLFGHDPAAIAAHYPELQKKSEELRAQNDAIQKSAGTAGLVAFAATAAVTGFLAFKKKISKNPVIAGIAALFSSITAGFAANFLTDKMLGNRVREESKDLAIAARKADERELAVYMEDTQRKLTARTADEEAAAKALVANQLQTENKWSSKEVQKTIAAAEAEKPATHTASVEKNRTEAKSASLA